MSALQSATENSASWSNVGSRQFEQGALPEEHKYWWHTIQTRGHSDYPAEIFRNRDLSTEGQIFVHPD